MWRGPLPGPKKGGKLGLFEATRPGAPSSWTRSPRWTWPSRPSSSGRSRRAASAGGRGQGAGHGCAGHCRLQREPPGLCGPGPVPQGSLLPAKHLSHPHPPLRERPAISPPWPAPSWTTSPASSTAASPLTEGRGEPPPGPRLARQCAGAAQRAGVLRLPLLLRHHHGGIALPTACPMTPVRPLLTPGPADPRL